MRLVSYLYDIVSPKSKATFDSIQVEPRTHEEFAA